MSHCECGAELRENDPGHCRSCREEFGRNRRQIKGENRFGWNAKGRDHFSDRLNYGFRLLKQGDE